MRSVLGLTRVQSSANARVQLVASGAEFHRIRLISPLVASCPNAVGHQKKKPAAGGGAAGFPIEPNDDWEEECRHSRSRPWEEEWAFCIIEASWEEVRCFDKYDYIRFLVIS